MSEALFDLLFARLRPDDWVQRTGGGSFAVDATLAAWVERIAAARVTPILTGGVTPVVVGITGSVAVGKTTVATALAARLRGDPWRRRVAVVATDGFLFPNAVLEQRGLLARKGFPESFDVAALVGFLGRIRAGIPASVPEYSHRSYDIVPRRRLDVAPADVVIVEGVNILQAGDGPIPPSDLLDLAVYLDAAEEDLGRWFADRLTGLIRAGATDPGSFYHQWSGWSAAEVADLSAAVWTGINLPNLRDHIAPSLLRADLVLTKGPDHALTAVRVRR